MASGYCIHLGLLQYTVTVEKKQYCPPKGGSHSSHGSPPLKYVPGLNVAVDDCMSFSSVGRRFHARGAATENTRSPIRRAGWKRSPLLEARSEERDGMLVTGVSRLVI